MKRGAFTTLGASVHAAILGVADFGLVFSRPHPVDVGQYASHAKSHVARQQQIHRLRHIINELCSWLPEQERDDPIVREMMGYGCKTTMRLANLLAPRLDGEDHTKDIAFARSSIRMRGQAEFVDAQRAVAARAWRRQADPLDGVVVHDISES